MKTKISAFQLFASIIVFEHGTAALFSLIPDTEQDAWIAILLYILPAILLQILYTSLWSNFPNDTIITYLPKIFGKYIGYVLSIIYILYFTYIASRVLRDFSELILISTLPKLPILLISLLLISVICYSNFIGIENLCRIAVSFLLIFLVFFILVFIFLSTTPNAFKINNLKPILHKGLLFLITKGWPLITFPFGEIILFSMYYPCVDKPDKVRKATIFATILEGILLSINSIMFICTLGVKFSSTSLFPLLQTFRVIHIGSAFDRLDMFIILILLLGGFFKISFFMYGAMLGTASLLKINNFKYLSIPFSILVLIGSQLIAPNYPQHIKIGLDYTIKYIHVPLIIIIPVAAFIVLNIKKLLIKKNSM